MSSSVYSRYSILLTDNYHDYQRQVRGVFGNTQGRKYRDPLEKSNEI